LWHLQQELPRKRTGIGQLETRGNNGILSPGSLFHGAKELPWHPQKESLMLHQKCRSYRGINMKGKHNRY
jgi:hypothetical protein